MSKRYGAIVIGAGPAGEVCAGELSDGGMENVMIIERELVAGECSFYACMPSKTLLRPPETVAAAKHAWGAREAVTGEIDIAEALEWRNEVVSNWDDSGYLPWLEERNIELVRGEGKIAGPGAVEVGGETYETDRIVLAMGSKAAIPPINGLEDLDGVWTNREVTSMKEIPKSILILGGGPVGVEMGQALTRYGAKVTLIEGQDRLLAREAPAVGETLAEALEEEGLDLRLGALAESAAKGGDGFELTLKGGDVLTAEKLLVATGRTPNLDVGLDNVGIEPTKTGVEVDERLRTSAEGIWAIGDVTGQMLFTHVGKYQAKIAAQDMLGKTARADYRAVPRVVFTDPQVAAVGEPDAEQTGTVELTDIARTSTYARNGNARGFLTLVSDGSKLTGAYAVGPEAGDWMGQATLAVRAGVPLDLMRDTIQPFPTFSEAFAAALADLD